MHPLVVLIATVIVLLLAWLFFAKWGYFVYYANLASPPKLEITKHPNDPSLVPVKFTSETKPFVDALYINRDNRYTLLLFGNARSQKIKTTLKQFKRLKTVMPFLYTDTSMLTKEFKKCVIEDIKLLDKIAKEYNSIYLQDEVLINSFPQDQQSNLKLYFETKFPNSVLGFNEGQQVENAVEVFGNLRV